MSVQLMPDKLRPCPFCGGEAELRAFYQNKADRRRTRIVVCKEIVVETCILTSPDTAKTMSSFLEGVCLETLGKDAPLKSKVLISIERTHLIGTP